jgi:hypothetical protein
MSLNESVSRNFQQNPWGVQLRPVAQRPFNNRPQSLIAKSPDQQYSTRPLFFDVILKPVQTLAEKVAKKPLTPNRPIPQKSLEFVPRWRRANTEPLFFAEQKEQQCADTKLKQMETVAEVDSPTKESILFQFRLGHVHDSDEDSDDDKTLVETLPTTYATPKSSEKARKIESNGSKTLPSPPLANGNNCATTHALVSNCVIQPHNGVPYTVPKVSGERSTSGTDAVYPPANRLLNTVRRTKTDNLQ